MFGDGTSVEGIEEETEEAVPDDARVLGAIVDVY
jgi:hypothetical protein